MLERRLYLPEQAGLIEKVARDMVFTPWGWIVLSCSAIFLGFSKTGLPGAGILAIPLIASIIPAKASTGLILPMLIIGDIFAVCYYRRHAVWHHLFRMLPYAVAGIFIGYWAMGKVTDNQLRPLIGIIILFMLALNLWRNRKGENIEIPPGKWFPAVMGLSAGITTMMANAAGPIMAIYLLAMRLPKNAFIGTGAWYFLLVNCFKVPFSAGLGLITVDSLKLNLFLAPLIILGSLGGIRAARHIPEKIFNILIQILAAAGAVRLLFP